MNTKGDHPGLYFKIQALLDPTWIYQSIRAIYISGNFPFKHSGFTPNKSSGIIGWDIYHFKPSTKLINMLMVFQNSKESPSDLN